MGCGRRVYCGADAWPVTCFASALPKHGDTCAVFSDHRAMLRLDVPRRATINESPQLARLVLEAEREKGPLELNCTKTEVFGPFGVAFLASCFAVRKKSERETLLITPSADEEAANTLDETGLVQLAHGESGAFDEWLVQPVSILDDTVVPDLSSKLVLPLTVAAVNAPAVVQTCLNVLLENLHRWSESSVGGFVVLHWHKKSHKVKVAFVDRGVGIPAALRRSPQSHLHRATDVEVIEAAFTDPSVTSRADGEQGQGLEALRETVLSHRGKLTVVSLGAKVTWSLDRLTKTTSPALHGTAIELELSA